MTPRRTASAAIMFGVFFLGLLVQKFYWLLPVLIYAAGVMCLIELEQLVRLKSLRFPLAFCLIFTLALMADGFWSGLDHGMYILVGATILLLTHRVLVSDYQNLAGEVGAALLATAYIGLPMGMAAAMSPLARTDMAPFGKLLLLYQLAVVFGGDTAAYFIGRKWGKHRFFPKISPRKTIEGAVASVTVSLLLAFVVTASFPTLRQFFGGWHHGLILGLVLGVMAPLGDLAESAFKRDAGRKDSGHDFTGHGGFLDIFDALLFGLPIQFCYIQLFHHMWSAASLLPLF